MLQLTRPETLKVWNCRQLYVPREQKQAKHMPIDLTLGLWKNPESVELSSIMLFLASQRYSRQSFPIFSNLFQYFPTFSNIWTARGGIVPLSEPLPLTESATASLGERFPSPNLLGCCRCARFGQLTDVYA